MKINTITCHNVYNYGASLQAFALQHFLEKQGCSYEIIDYKPSYFTRKYQFTTISKQGKYYKYYKLMGPFKVMLALWVHRHTLKFWRRKKSFDKFTKEYLHLTARSYSCNDEMKDIKDVDLFITGSDQVWNSNMPNGRDKSFFLDFVPDGSRRISYAASFGISYIDPDYIHLAKESLEKFEWISVRESTGVHIVEKLGLNAQQVVDPVFLLEAEEWKHLIKAKHCERYILLYYLGKPSLKLEAFVKHLAKDEDLIIVSINDTKTVDFADVNINDAGPKEFLEYLSQAQYVIGTSFHAMAFSLIFEREFYVFPIEGQTNHSRMKDLLSMLDLSERFITDDASTRLANINYRRVTPLLDKCVKCSKELLLKRIKL